MTKLSLAFCAWLAALTRSQPARATLELADGAGDGHRAEAASQVPQRSSSAQLTLQSFWTEGKVVPGFAFGLRHEWFQLDLETSLLWLTDSDPAESKNFLGSGFGGHLMYLPVRERAFDLGVGLGCDVYWLWNVHGDAVEQALALKAAGHVWLTPSLGVYASARAYPWHSSGLELGTHQNGEGALPVLFTTGLTWKL